MKSACGTLLIAGVLLWTFGALVAMRIGGAPTALAWSAATPICIVVGVAAFLLVAARIGDPKQTMRLIVALPVLRMVAVGLLGWLVIGFLPMEAQGSFWLNLVAAYLATLTIETGLLARFVRRTTAAKSVDVQGAA